MAFVAGLSGLLPALGTTHLMSGVIANPTLSINPGQMAAISQQQQQTTRSIVSHAQRQLASSQSRQPLIERAMHQGADRALETNSPSEMKTASTTSSVRTRLTSLKQEAGGQESLSNVPGGSEETTSVNPSTFRSGMQSIPEVNDIESATNSEIGIGGRTRLATLKGPATPRKYVSEVPGGVDPSTAAGVSSTDRGRIVAGVAARTLPAPLAAGSIFPEATLDPSRSRDQDGFRTQDGFQTQDGRWEQGRRESIMGGPAAYVPISTTRPEMRERIADGINRQEERIVERVVQREREMSELETAISPKGIIFNITIQTVIISALIFVLMLTWFEFVRTWYDETFDPTLGVRNVNSIVVRFWYAIYITCFVIVIVYGLYRWAKSTEHPPECIEQK